MHEVAKILSGILLSLLLFAGVLSANEPVSIPWLQDNLVTNADFEEVAGDGRTPQAWTAQIAPDSGAAVETDSAVFLKGRRSLRIAAPKAGTTVTASSPQIPVEGDATYLASIAFRQEGFNAAGQPSLFEGVSAYAWGHWLDESRQQIGQFVLPFPYGPSHWDLRDAFQRAPTKARFAQLGVVVANDSQKQTGKTVPSTLWIDAVQLRKYLPPVTPEWAKGETARVVDGAAKDTRLLSYFVGCDDSFAHMRGGSWSQIVNDPQAERGAALAARTNAAPGYMAHSPYFPALPAGLYRVRARVRIPAVKDPAPVGNLDIDSQFAGLRQLVPFVPSREAEGKYIDVEADFILRDSGYWDLRLYTHGKATWFVDSLKIFCLHELEDRQLLAIYPGSEGELPADLKPVPGGSVNPTKGLMVAGLGYDRFRIADVFHILYLETVMKVVWAKSGMGGMSFAGFPEDPRDLFQYSIIYLCNVNVRAVALKYKHALREYVKRGGALVVMGGQQGYERGGWRGSLIEETMPVESAPALPGGLVCRPKGLPLKVSQEVPWLEAISTASSPLVYYLHAATVKPSGRVLVQAGKYPFLVTGVYGAGRVVCLLGLPWGDPGPHATPFWEWDDWVPLLREASWWAMKHSE